MPRKPSRRLAVAAVVSLLALFATAIAGAAGSTAAVPGVLSFSSANYSVSEAAGSATITLTRAGGTDSRVAAKVSLTDVTAARGADYLFAPGSLDTSFNPGSGTDDLVRGLATQPDGKIVIVGDFTTYNGTSRLGVARLNTDGSLDTSFNPGVGAGNPGGFHTVYAVAVQPDGKVIIGGLFESYNGTAVNSIARINTDGSLDSSFNTGTGALGVRALAVQSDGKVLIGGSFSSYNGNPSSGIARLNSNGSFDSSFNVGSGVNDNVLALASQSDGKVVIGGHFNTVNGTASKHIARLNANGSLDTSFNVGSGFGTDALHLGGPMGMVVQPDGKVLIAGGFVSYNGTAAGTAVRLNSDGSLDPTFNAAITDQPVGNALALQPDGKVLVGFTPSNGTPVSTVARLNSDGTLDTSFNPGSTAAQPVLAVGVEPDGRIAIGGHFTSYSGTSRNRIALVTGDLFATWEAGDAADKTVSLPIVNDSLVETNETLSLTLTTYGGAGTGTVTNATLTILDNETVVSNVSGAGVYAGTATLTATLSAGGAPVAGKSVGFTLNGSAVGNATTNAAGVATLTNVSLTGVNVGTYPGAVGASFSGDSGLTGSSATGTLNVSKADQTINFAALADKTFGDADFSLNASASSSLAVSFSASGQCSASNGTLHITGAGSCTVTASQAGNSNYNAAPNVERTFQIAKAATTTTVASSVNPSAVGQSVTLTATVTSAAGTPSGAVQFKANGASIGAPVLVPLNASGVATFTISSGFAPGSYVITAEYGGDSNFSASTGTLAAAQLVGAIVEFGQSAYNVAEGVGSLEVNVRRGGDTSTAADVDYATDDGSTPSVATPCSATTGLALDRCDYTKALGTLHFAAGETEKRFRVLVSDDTYTEGPETTQLKLSNPSGGATLGANGAAVLTITDDSPESSGNAIDDDTKFVTQHYHDFLNREPDASGLDFWRSQITSCGADAQCREVKRVNVSAAFFVSIEFQNTGYLVYRMYKSAYGDATSPGVAGTVPVIRLNEFLPDTQRIGRNVIVGEGAWPMQLESNKNVYALEFVQRSRFTTAFPASLTAAQFVDRLAQNAGVTLSQTERDSLIFTLGATPADPSKRAQVVRAVAEHEQLRQGEFNRAFVLMEYFGYLRRNPDDAPNTNYEGWKFWLDKLNEFNGNYIRAEMVKAFISSDEYRKRFGQ